MFFPIPIVRINRPMTEATWHSMTSTEVTNLKLGIYADISFHELFNDINANKENEMIR